MPAEENRKRRVLVGMGGCDIPDRMMRVAGELAAAMNAELYGLFVDEEYLLDLSGLPFAKTVGTSGQAPRALTEQLMTDALRSQANLFRRSLTDIAQKANLNLTFARARGRAARELLAAARKQDFVVLQATSTVFTVRDMMRAGRTVAAEARGIVICGQHRQAASGPVVAIDDGDETGRQTLRFAERIATTLDAPISLLVIAGSDDKASQIEARAVETLKNVKQLKFHRLASWGADELEVALQDLHPSFVVADLEGEPFTDDETASAVIRAAGAPVLLIRPEKSI